MTAVSEIRQGLDETKPKSQDSCCPPKKVFELKRNQGSRIANVQLQLPGDDSSQVGESPSSTARVRKLGSSQPMTSQRQYLSSSRFRVWGLKFLAVLSVLALVVAVVPVVRKLLNHNPTLNYQN